ncbi:MAG TPA: ATP-binding protein [Acidobacteriaceae bacterium]
MDEAGEQAKVRVLLLEDSPQDAELVANRLERAGLPLEMYPAHDRASYYGQLGARQYDLILADYALPDFDGLAALEAARALDPHLPFVFISGRVGEEVAIESLQRGATDYVLKQRMERLVPAVKRALKEADEHARRRHVEQSFRESEARFLHVINALPQMVWISAPDGELTYTNKAWLEHVPPKTRTWLDPGLIHPDERAGCAASWERSLARHTSFSCECRMMRRDGGGYRWQLVRMVPLLGSLARDGEPCVEWLGTATDLQEQKLHEEALRTAETLAVSGRMMASIAHEINNPLESLINLIFLARLESQENPRALAYLDMSENELERVSTITKQTLQFYRDPATPTEIDGRSILEDVLRLFSTRLTARAVRVELTAEKNVVLTANRGEIRQVLINLVGNAIDAVSRGGTVCLSAKQVAGQRRETGASAGGTMSEMVEFVVCDNGVGLAEEKAERLFQPFFSTKGAHGTGLGLWVSKGIVEKHGGSISLVTEPGEGGKWTTATVLLPRDAVDELHAGQGGA